MSDKIKKSDEESKQQLSEEQFRIARQAGTEPAFSGEYYLNKQAGKYRCICCGEELFSSNEKYDSGSGWPSFYKPRDDMELEEIRDTSHGMIRVEVR